MTADESNPGTVILPVRYHTENGRIRAVYWNGMHYMSRITGSALTTNGRDLEAFERALDKLRNARKG